MCQSFYVPFLLPIIRRSIFNTAGSFGLFLPTFADYIVRTQSAQELISDSRIPELALLSPSLSLKRHPNLSRTGIVLESETV